MNDDELKKLWQQQPLREPPSAAQLISAAQKQTSELRRCLDARDIRELVVCAALVVVFGVFYFTVYRTPVSRLGALVIIGGLVFIACKIVYTRLRTPPARPGATTVEFLRAELKSVRAQSQLLGSILWWYLLPLAIGLFLCTWGDSSGGVGGKIGSTIFVIALFAFIYWLNQRARAIELLPMEAQLESLLHSSETGEPVDETQVANLRPIVLSIAAADQIKPAEFKVAFWQIALWGEIGFIGIWFFLMLGLSLSDDAWRIKGNAPFVQNVGVQETNRYSVVARRVIDLLNADDYAAVQELYNLEMSAAFPPEETSDFYRRLTARYGDIGGFEASSSGYAGWTAFRLHGQRGEVIMSLALDADDKISGIHFRGAPMSAANIGALLRHIFGWQRLVWVVPFFFGGLLYAGILQKTTERAVGISALGVHLHKGKDIFVWDEIKEVRPIRVLNMRSLWLIQESGEKTIMPWTSLERHSDLKRAVEQFAPANHPLRKYLSLLKRF
jgi:hypothetical protein